jgi:hypothetical protein
MESSAERVPFPEVAAELAAMRDADQSMRERNLADPEEWDEELDRKNTERMKQIIADIGWPTSLKVGAAGADHAWILVQHADHDPAFQEHCLHLMRESSGEALNRHIAYLEDRVRVNKGQPQLYGTQFYDSEAGYGPREIEAPEKLDERRREMGLEPFEEYRKGLLEKYKMNK